MNTEHLTVKVNPFNMIIVEMTFCMWELNRLSVAKEINYTEKYLKKELQRQIGNPETDKERLKVFRAAKDLVESLIDEARSNRRVHINRYLRNKRQAK
jgi:hypothetical protein